MILRRKVELNYQSATDFYCVATAKLENVDAMFSSFLLMVLANGLFFNING